MSKIILAAGNKVSEFKLAGVLTIGGSESSGKKLQSLKHSDDYALIAPQGENLGIHPLKGKTKGPIVLKSGGLAHIEDLTIGFLPGDIQVSNRPPPFVDHYAECIKALSGGEDLNESMQHILKVMTVISEVEKGLIILKNIKGDYHLVAQIGLEVNDSWLSEKLVQSTLKTQKSIVIQNIVGSQFEGNHSLMASGFISAFTWPLVVRGETLGVVVLGSSRPHSGLSHEQLKHGESLSQLAALMLWFHLRDLKLREELTALRENQNPSEAPLLTTDPKLLGTLDLARQVAPTKLSLIIQGETGVGKELLAKWIHQTSDRKGGPFIAVNCGAIPGELLESLLFGHKKGSFTHAFSDQVGKFQAAQGGTLFLDEIGDLPASLQVKLLRVLQEKTVEPIGSSKPIPIDVRLIAATHKNLSELVAKDIFREDLYFRLSELTLYIPPLRERAQDIGLLATDFLKSIAPEKRFSTQGWNWLKSKEWRGNGRELLSTIKRAAILSHSSEISLNDLSRGEPARYISKDSDWLGGRTLDEAKSSFIQQKVEMALQKANGQKTAAAKLLGVTPRTLFRYLEERSETDLS